MPNEPGNYWGSDALISMPAPSKHDIIITLGSFGLTEYGIDHNINVADIEHYLPTFGPEALDE